jgi:hypothetical protein
MMEERTALVDEDMMEVMEMGDMVGEEDMADEVEAEVVDSEAEEEASGEDGNFSKSRRSVFIRRWDNGLRFTRKTVLRPS